MGGRDCSLQMHEQKLLEVSVTVESLQRPRAQAEASRTGRGRGPGDPDARTTVKTLQDGDRGSRFGEAVGLDSVSTFECIVDRLTSTSSWR